jgi:hypothetical protein
MSERKVFKRLRHQGVLALREKGRDSASVANSFPSLFPELHLGVSPGTGGMND